jgi:hypothetical protein
VNRARGTGFLENEATVLVIEATVQEMRHVDFLLVNFTSSISSTQYIGG